MVKQKVKFVSLEDNWNEVSAETWGKLFTMIEKRETQLGEMIELSTQPTVSKKARAALDKFLHKINELNSTKDAA